MHKPMIDPEVLGEFRYVQTQDPSQQNTYIALHVFREEIADEIGRRRYLEWQKPENVETYRAS